MSIEYTVDHQLYTEMYRGVHGGEVTTTRPPSPLDPHSIIPRSFHNQSPFVTTLIIQHNKSFSVSRTESGFVRLRSVSFVSVLCLLSQFVYTCLFLMFTAQVFLLIMTIGMDMLQEEKSNITCAQEKIEDQDSTVLPFPVGTSVLSY